MFGFIKNIAKNKQLETAIERLQMNMSNNYKDAAQADYKELMESDCTKAMCVSSCLECLPYCNSCAYQPYCGTCPVINLAQDGSIFSKNPKEYRCKIYGGMLDILFDYIENDKEAVEIFYKWID